MTHVTELVGHYDCEARNFVKHVYEVYILDKPKALSNDEAHGLCNENDYIAIKEWHSSGLLLC